MYGACPGAFIENTVSNSGALVLLARAADLPDFTALEAHVVETQQKVRACFARILAERA